MYRSPPSAPQYRIIQPQMSTVSKWRHLALELVPPPPPCPHSFLFPSLHLGVCSNYPAKSLHDHLIQNKTPISLHHFFPPHPDSIFRGSYPCLIRVCMCLCLFTNCLPTLERMLCESRDSVPFVPYPTPNIYIRGRSRCSIDICWVNE